MQDYSFYELTQVVEINREQAAEILSSMKRHLRQHAKKEDSISFPLEEIKDLYNQSFSVNNMEEALWMKERLGEFQNFCKQLVLEEEALRPFSIIFEEIVETLLDGKTPVEHPVAYILGGQSGAGKSSRILEINASLNSNVVIINGDDFRREHPKYINLLQEYGEDFVQHTGNFSGQVIRQLIEYCAKRNYHVIVEGTLRAKQVPFNTSKLFHRYGYRTVLQVMAVSPKDSYEGTVERYEKMKERGMTARPTPKHLHDNIVFAIGKNLSEIYLAKEFDEISLFNREGDCLYSFLKNPSQDPKEILDSIFSENIL